ncbi:MAG: aspartate aminotransferase family protein [Alphaproteobacteria bacterium]|nr:aspartate aminotransferase family protein [Alphaproteobacteria bacterium]
MNARPLRNLDLETAYLEAEQGYVRATPESRRRNEENGRVMPGGNTRTVLHFQPYPATVVKGEGCYVWDADGRKYIDFVCEYTAGLYGHSNPLIQDAVREALASGIVLGAPNRYEGQLAAALTQRFPSIELIRFCNSGTEANLFAILAARAATGRPAIMVFDHGYHGGCFYYAHGSQLNAPFETVIANYNDVEGTRRVIAENAGWIASITVEPMQGGGGCVPADQAFLEMLRAEATRHGIVLIFDEVMTSRLSSGGLQKVTGVIPDMTTLGKYLGGGLTFGAFGGTRRIMGRFDPRSENSFGHAGTFNNNVLTMAAGATGITKVYTAEAATALNQRGDALRDRLNAIASKRSVPVQFTGRGSMMNLHVNVAPIRTPADVERDNKRAMDLIHLDLLARGLYTARRGFIVLSLPMGDREFDALATAIDEVLSDRAAVLADAG